jgi:long-chain acyl-CoA synthetase
MPDTNAEQVQQRIDTAYRELGIDPGVDLSRFDNLVHMAEHAFSEHADKAAFTSLGHTLRFRDLDRLSNQFASWVQHVSQLQPGDRIAVQLPNLLQYPVVVFGALRAGLVVVNINPLYSERELEHQLNDSGAKALVVLANVASTAAAVLPRTGVRQVLVTELADLHPPLRRALVNGVARHVKHMVPAFEIPGAVSLNKALRRGARRVATRVPTPRDGLAMLQYTGGTTGVAKGAMLSHSNLVANVLQVDDFMVTQPLGPEDRTVVQPLPVYHIYAFMSCVYAMVNGLHMVFVPNPRDLSSVVKVMARYRPALFFGLNTLFVALCNNAAFRQLDFSALKVTMSGGMALTHAAAQHWEEITGCAISEGYGLTETSPVVSANPGSRKILGTIGLPLPGTAVKVVDDQGQELPVGEPGELCVRGPQVMQGYWQRPEETAAVLDTGGWFRTGDIAIIREDGYLQIVDRKKDMILVSGFNVFPNEIEDVLYEHEDVLECAAVGVPDATTGEAVKIFVVSASGQLSADEVKAFCRRSLAAYKVPRQIEFRTELPKTNVGKILRRELRDQA